MSRYTDSTFHPAPAPVYRGFLARVEILRMSLAQRSGNDMVVLRAVAS